MFTRVVPDEGIIMQSSGGVESSFDWTLSSEGSSTRMTADVDYTIPVPVLGKLAEKVVLAQNEHEAEVTLANLKVRMEA